MTEDRCHRCDEVTDVWTCQSCDELTCESCFSPQSPMSTDPVTNCLTCDGQADAAREQEMDRRNEIERIKRERRDKANRTARARYWRPENIRKRREAKAERSRRKAAAALKNLRDTLRIVGGMMR